MIRISIRNQSATRPCANPPPGGPRGHLRVRFSPSGGRWAGRRSRRIGGASTFYWPGHACGHEFPCGMGKWFCGTEVRPD